MAIDSIIAAFDPIVANTTCLFLETIPKSANWYYSTDIVMDASSMWPAQGKNITHVTVNWTGDCSVTFPTLIKHVVVDLYIGDPTLSMVPGISLKALAKGTLALIAPGTQTVDITWNTADAGTTTSHFCMLARCYPESAVPCDDASQPCGGSDPTQGISPFAHFDPHYAQLNLAAVPVEQGPQAIRLPIKIGNIGKRPIEVTIEATPDLEPTRQTLDVILPVLQNIKGFKQIAKKPLRRVEFDLSNFGKHHTGIWEEIESIADKIEDALEGFFTCHYSDDGKTHAKVAIRPNVFAPFHLVPDTSGAQPGDAYIYQITQADPKGLINGGVAVVFVVV